MTDKELRQRLYTALDHAAPNDIEGVLSRCQPRTGKVVPISSGGKKARKKWVPALAAACVALVVAGGGFQYYMQNNTVASIVLLDVNPSVELTVNQKEKVLSATPANEDASVILDGMDLRGAHVDVAMNAIVGSLLQHGFVDELANSILITVEDTNAERGAQLQQDLTAQADAILSSAQVHGAILSQTIQDSQLLQQQAETYGISAGKVVLIQTIVDASGGLHTFEELVGLSINELNLLYTSLTTQNSNQQTQPTTPSHTIQSSGEASVQAYIGTEAAQAAAFAHAGVSSSDAVVLEVDYDYEDGCMVYEIEFVVGSVEYEYDIDAATGAVIKYQKEGGHTPVISQNQPQTGTATTEIGEKQAKSIAFSHAGVSESQVSSLRVERDLDDGRLEYEVSFWVGDTEYEYTIDAASGGVYKSESKTHTVSSTGDIGEAQAKSIALTHAGLAESEVFELKVKREVDDIQLEYEVEFKTAYAEYEYKIDGATGSILEFEQD